MSHPKKTDFSANEELKIHVPLLVRWGVACLMVMVALAVLAVVEGQVNFLAGAVFLAVWLLSLWKAAQSAFTVVAALLERRQDSKSE